MKFFNAMQKVINILAISGSLRNNSSNTMILRFLATHSPVHVKIKLFEGLVKLPHFDPDATAGEATVANFRQQLKAADAVIICTPEYAFGVPGVLKNALDWTVSSGEFNEKPVAAISASPLPSGGDKAMASLLWTLTALGTNTPTDLTLSIAGSKKKINEKGEITDQQTINELNSTLLALATIAEKARNDKELA